MGAFALTAILQPEPMSGAKVDYAGQGDRPAGRCSRPTTEIAQALELASVGDVARMGANDQLGAMSLRISQPLVPAQNAVSLLDEYLLDLGV